MTNKHANLSIPSFFYFEQLASTNSKLKEISESQDLEEMSMVITPEQYAGRGQLGNSWESESGKNLTFSFFIKPQFLAIQKQFIISKIVSLSIIKALEKKGISHLKIKWPNDIYHKEKKLAGILIENSIMGSSIYNTIIGVGLNVNQTVFHSDAPNPVSLKQITDHTYELNPLLETIFDHFIALYNELKEEKYTSIDQSYLDHLYLYQQTASFKDKNGIFQATLSGVDKTGKLMLQTESGDQRKYGLKEIEFLL